MWKSVGCSGDVLAYLETRHPALGRQVDSSKPLLLPAPAFLAAVRFARKCWSVQQQKSGEEPPAEMMERYLRLLEVLPSFLHRQCCCRL